MRLISHPVLCNYYITYRCNAKCGFCDIWEKPSPYANIDNVSANLKSLKKLGVKVIDFTGGEPLLHQSIDKLLTLAKSMGFITTLTTNCLLYPKWAERIKGKVDMLHFSLDSPIKTKHDTGRGVACFDFVMESIDIAKKLGERPDILYTVFEDNVKEIEPLYHNVSLPNGLVLILNPVFGYNDIDMDSNLSPSALDALLKWGKRKKVYVNEAFIALRKDGGNKVASPVCKAGSSTIVISPSNELILPCYHLGLEKIPIDKDLWEIYNTGKVKKLIALEGRQPGCEGCTVNCYMQPSFAVEINKYWWKALPSTIKYNRMKSTWKQLVNF